ncbi:Inorganic diphosphatase [Pyrolobus fumarii 1A]|uniref:Inorganic pyrophosphatase n=1 Tax=Pyrolobus fumarii (strain DSM 11204 / 1A) TaxID=694429 RepID=G0EC71_PYRF1|nr:inorganic diphosphatase [Pyrolobus fumarii]AEM39441.1 Inorganic diphosphatase [Pyrolobus fumarii 1A]
MVDLEKIGPGEKAPEIVNVLIEIPMGSGVKYEFDKEAGVIKVDRFLYTSMVYPFNYGFIPGTMEEDGDPVDVLVITREPLLPGVVIEARPVALLIMEDEEGPDSKVVAVPKDKLDPTFSNIRDVNDLPEALKERIKHFFEHYKELEPGKWVKVKEWRGADEARKKIMEAIRRYREAKS